MLTAVGAITRTYISSTGVAFTPGAVAVFDGLMYVQSLVEPWYKQRAEADDVGEAERERGRATPSTPVDPPPSHAEDDLETKLHQLSVSAKSARPVPPITTSEPIVDRKSSFVGHACRIKDEEDVMAVVAHLLTDRRIARAAHPTIWAYRTVREMGGAAGRVVESGEFRVGREAEWG